VNLLVSEQYIDSIMHDATIKDLRSISVELIVSPHIFWQKKCMLNIFQLTDF